MSVHCIPDIVWGDGFLWYLAFTKAKIHLTLRGKFSVHTNKIANVGNFTLGV